MRLELEYVSPDNIEFKLMNDNVQIGEVTLMSNVDCYVVSFELFKHKFKATEIYPMYKIDRVMNQLMEYFNDNLFVLFEDLPVLLLEERFIADRYAMEHDLQRVPRFCGYYLMNKGDE